MTTVATLPDLDPEHPDTCSCPDCEQEKAYLIRLICDSVEDLDQYVGAPTEPVKIRKKIKSSQQQRHTEILDLGML